MLASGETYSIPGSNSVASRTTRTPGVANVTYRLNSSHWILPLSSNFCTTTRLDRYQFTNIGPPYIGGNYGASQTFFGYDPGFITGACVLGWIYLGQTTESKTVPSVTITNPRIGSIPPQSTQTALLGADVVLGSSVAPPGGSYSWTFTGPYSISGGSTSSSSVTIRSTDVGSVTVFTEYPVRRFSEGNDLTMLNVDYPNQALTFGPLWEHVDALEIDDRFQMYVVYFTFDPRFPSISRTLGKLDWNFGGVVVFDRPGSHQIRSNFVTPRNLTGQATTSMVTMQGNVKDNNVLPCPGAPAITFNRIDATRYFVRQHYLDFLGREPDLDGWNWWTSEITECAFDLNCIHTERMHIGHAFLLVANSVVQDPDMANPPGTPGFNAATYNRAFVRHCYLNYLLREPDIDGWNHWTNELNSDGNYWHILDAFQLAPQYRNRFCVIC